MIINLLPEIKISSCEQLSFVNNKMCNLNQDLLKIISILYFCQNQIFLRRWHTLKMNVMIKCWESLHIIFSALLFTPWISKMSTSLSAVMTICILFTSATCLNTTKTSNTLAHGQLYTWSYISMTVFL